MPLFGTWVPISAQTAPTTVSSEPAWLSASATSTGTGLGLQQLYAAQAAQRATVPSWYSSQQAQTLTTATTSGTSVFGIYLVGNEQVDHSQYMALAQQRVVQYRERTEEERRAAEAMHAEAAERSRRRHEEHQAALARSRELLLSHLTPRQRETFEECGWFIVRGGRTMTRYRIRTGGYTHNIEVLRGHDERVSYRLCAHCRGNIPLHDHHLTQKLSLECDEDYFLSIANRSAA